MNQQQHENLRWSIASVTKRIQEVGNNDTFSLPEKRFRLDCQLIILLEHIVPVLPRRERDAIKKCLSLYEQIWYEHVPSQKSDSPLQLPH